MSADRPSPVYVIADVLYADWNRGYAEGRAVDIVDALSSQGFHIVHVELLDSPRECERRPGQRG